MRKLAMWLGVMLAGCSAHSNAPQPAPIAPVDTGARIYAGNCVACHQADGRGIPGVYPSLAGSPVLDGDAQELARWVIRGRRPAAMSAGRYSTAMPPFGWLTPTDAAALFTYLRGHFGNAAPPVEADTVARALEP